MQKCAPGLQPAPQDVFLAKSIDSSNFRIGWTKDLTKRKKQLHATNESSLRIVKYFYTPSPHSDRRALLPVFSKYHKHNDWYEVDDFDTFEKDTLKYFYSYTWSRARKEAIKTLEGFGVKNDLAFQTALLGFYKPMRDVGTPIQMNKFDYSINKIRESILNRGKPQEVAMAFLYLPEALDALYDSDDWEADWERGHYLAKLRFLNV